MGRKMHAGEMKKGRGQRAHGGKLPAGIVEMLKPEEKREEKFVKIGKNGGKNI